ncbi:DUF6538 domain-containing protein [Paraburkholderia sp. RL17-373-BIF-A]|uniref:DUF6538 domain-containing protein n=1 Tax=Paraburkholderia sp. RL17-373-BIF-A TaxID=3031629 RepID=UPI0038BDEFBF
MTDMPVTLPAGVSLRGSVFHLRIGVPKEVQPVWPRQKNGKLAVDAYRASLKTSNRNEAAVKAHAIIAEYQRQFAKLLADAQPAPFTPITDELVAYIVQKTEQMILAMDDVLRHNPEYFAQWYGTRKWRGFLTGRTVNPTWETTGRSLTPDQLKDVERIHNEMTVELQTDLSMGNLDAAQRQAEFACGALAQSLRVDWTTDEGRNALQKVLRAMVRAWKGVRERNRGEPIETPSEPKEPVSIIAKPEEPAAPSMTLRDVVPFWRRLNAPKDNAVGRTAKALALFEQAVGIVELRDLKKAHGVAFVQFLLDTEARKFANKTAGNHAAAINALMNVAEKVDLVERNPFDLSFDKTIGAQKREPWTDGELDLMFASSLFSASMNDTPRWEGVEPSDGRATILLMLHTGARIGEIAQLRSEDFLSRNGVTAIRITAEAGKVKTQESERVVPLAAHLLDDPWFANWLSGVMSGTGPAMPSMAGRAKGPGDTAGQWFRQFRAATGLPPGDLKGAHRFRHWIRTALAEQNIGEATMDAITGHSATGSSGRKVYTAAASLPTMKAALDRVTWPDIRRSPCAVPETHAARRDARNQLG